jgi:hypothetical protein
MTTPTRKYYVLIPAAFRYSGEAFWKELCAVKDIISKAKTLTSAQRYVDRVFGGLPAPEIGASINGAKIKVISKKPADGEWEVAHKRSRSQS